MCSPTKAADCKLLSAPRAAAPPRVLLLVHIAARHAIEAGESPDNAPCLRAGDRATHGSAVAGHSARPMVNRRCGMTSGAYRSIAKCRRGWYRRCCSTRARVKGGLRPRGGGWGVLCTHSSFPHHFRRMLRWPCNVIILADCRDHRSTSQTRMPIQLLPSQHTQRAKCLDCNPTSCHKT